MGNAWTHRRAYIPRPQVCQPPLPPQGEPPFDPEPNMTATAEVSFFINEEETRTAHFNKQLTNTEQDIWFAVDEAQAGYVNTMTVEWQPEAATAIATMTSNSEHGFKTWTNQLDVTEEEGTYSFTGTTWEGDDVDTGTYSGGWTPGE